MKKIIVVLGFLVAAPSWGDEHAGRITLEEVNNMQQNPSHGGVTTVSNDMELRRVKRAAQKLIPAIMAHHEILSRYIADNKTDGDEWRDGAFHFSHVLSSHTLKLIQPYINDFHTSVILYRQKPNGHGGVTNEFVIGERFDDFEPTGVLTPAGDIQGLSGDWYIIDPEYYRDTMIEPDLQSVKSVLHDAEINKYMDMFRVQYDKFHSLLTF